MTDENKPVDPAETEAKRTDAKGTTPSRRIKIGSQREPGEASVPPAAAAPIPPAPTPADSAVTDSEEPKPTSEGSESAVQEAAAPTSSPATMPPETNERAARSARARRLATELTDEINDALGGMSLQELMEGSSSSPSGNVQEIELDQRYQATVIKIDRESAFFNLGVQNEGIASLKQFGENVPEIGQRMEVVPTRFNRDENLYELVVPGASVEVQDWSDLSEGVVVEAKITGHNKGGLECEVNRIRGFIPISQISLYRVDDLEPYVGQALQCVVTEANPDRRNLVLSHRAVLEREKQEAREELMQQLEVGQIREGVVRRIQDFGAFVDIGGVDGLIHISQLSWDRVAHPSEVVEEGQNVRVRIEKIDSASGKIGLSYRDLLEHPWEDIDSKFPVGAVIEGVVSKIMQFGAFVRIASGVEGLVHISELAHHRVQRVSSVVQEGKPVQVKVLAVDPQGQKMSLSIKAVHAAAEADVQTDTTEDDDAADSPPPKRRLSDESLKGGLGRDSGGEQFGLKW